MEELAVIRSKIQVLPERPPFMLDRDVAEVYRVETKNLNRQADRNPERFPEDFRFQLGRSEVTKCHLDYRGGHLPWCYT